MSSGPAVIGVVLAGGGARRMGGAKATALLGRRPLVSWTIDALRAGGVDRVVVAAKARTALPDVDADVWIEPAQPRHPLAGIAHALARAGEEDLVTLPVDLPLVPRAVVRALVKADGCAVVRAGGRLQPLVARFPHGTAISVSGRATDAVLALDPEIIETGDEGFLNVNTPEDLRAAEGLLRGGRAR